jgi:hypothetical protein
VCKSFADWFSVIYFGFLGRRLKRDFARGTIFAQTLERGLADELVSRPTAKFHFAHELRLGPAHTLFGPGRHGITQRRLGETELIQSNAQRPRLLARIAGADTAGVEQRAVRVIPKKQCSDRALRGRRWDIAENDKLLAENRLCLLPVIAPSRAIWQVAALGDDALQSESCCMFEHGGPILTEMFAVANG